MLFYLNEFYNFISRICFRLYHYILLPLRYKIQIKGIETLQSGKTDPKAGFLFLSNHPTHLDASLVGTALIKSNMQVTIWTVDYVFKNPYTRLVARNFDTTKLLKVPNIHENRSFKNPSKVRKLIRRTVEGLQREKISFFSPAELKNTQRERKLMANQLFIGF